MNPLTTYWLCRTPGATPEGPFTLGQIRKMYDGGAITAEGQICRNGEEEWTGIDDELAAVEIGSEPVMTAPQRQRVRGKKKRKSKAGCGPAILFLLGLFFLVVFMPLGLGLLLVALILDHVSYYHACNICGNEVAKSSLECPNCKARF